jgi:GTPase
VGTVVSGIVKSGVIHAGDTVSSMFLPFCTLLAS